MVRMVETPTGLANTAIEKGAGLSAPPIVKETNDPKFGDYQINGVLPLAKSLKKNPREIAAGVVCTGVWRNVRRAGDCRSWLHQSSYLDAWLGKEARAALDQTRRYRASREPRACRDRLFQPECREMQWDTCDRPSSVM